VQPTADQVLAIVKPVAPVNFAQQAHVEAETPASEDAPLSALLDPSVAWNASVADLLALSEHELHLLRAAFTPTMRACYPLSTLQKAAFNLDNVTVEEIDHGGDYSDETSEYVTTPQGSLAVVLRTDAED
jgi:hypothetical protein